MCVKASVERLSDTLVRAGDSGIFSVFSGYTPCSSLYLSVPFSQIIA